MRWLLHRRFTLLAPPTLTAGALLLGVLALSTRFARLTLLSLVVFATAVTATPRGARAQAPNANAELGTPSDSIVHVPDPTAALPDAPADYTREVVGTVTWDYPSQAQSEARELIAAWRPAWDRIETDLGEALDSSMHIRVARNATEMRALAPVRSPPPEYAAGVTYPALGLILLTFTAPHGVEPPDIQKVLVHELSHLALHRAVRGNPVPRWFSEGLAIHQASELSFERAKVLMRATYASERIPLRELSQRFPSRAYEVDLAYAQSADIVRFLLDDPRGSAKLRRLVRGLRDGAPFGDALEQAYYMRPVELEREWVEDLSTRNRLFPLLLGGGIAWTLAALLLPIAYVRRRRRAKAKLAAMARRETEERAERLRQLIETLRARQAVWVVAQSTLSDPNAPHRIHELDGSNAHELGGESTARVERRRDGAAPLTGSPRGSGVGCPGPQEGSLPVIQVGDETHTLH